MRIDRGRLAATATAIACAIGFSASLFRGVPVLRHDWPSPYLSLGAELGSLAGWQPWGLGGPVGYPSSFVVATLYALGAQLAGAGTMAIVAALVLGGLAAFGAQAVVARFTAAPVARIAAAIFAVFNPWVYTQLVAGHTIMLLSYGGSMFLLAEALKANPSQARIALIALAVTAQIQFLVLGFATVVILTVRKRLWTALAAWTFLVLPVAVGVLVNAHALSTIAVHASWERLASVAFLDAVLLTGYFAKYATSFAVWPLISAMTVIALVALAGGVALLLRRPRWWPVPACTLLAIVAVLGLHAPWSGLAAFAFDEIPASGLFRELYDLVGVIAIGYVALCASCAAYVRGAGIVWLAAACVLPFGWYARPPSTFWLTANEVPRVGIAAPANTRYVLLPAFQPLTFARRGSGIDPESYPRADGVTPLNATFPAYPLDARLSAYLRTGDDALLQPLSVAVVAARPWLSTNAETLEQQTSLPLPAMPRVRAIRTHALAPLPELSIAAPPAIGTLDTNLGAGNVFFGDARDATGAVPARWRSLPPVTAVSPSSDGIDARLGWVDVRGAFVAEPALGQPFGGALTTDSRALLRVRPGTGALAFVSGRLLAADGSLIARTTQGYRWIAIPAGVSGVRCDGVCVVALQGNPPHAPLQPQMHSAEGVPFAAKTPWWIVATLPAHGAGLLRYNVAFDPHWAAYVEGTALPHVRVDGTVNGWLLAASATPASLIVVENGAVAIAVAEIVAIAGFIACLSWALARERRAPSLQARPDPGR